jgi:hypothetical protein
MTEFVYSLKKWRKTPQQFMLLSFTYSLYLFLLVIALAVGEIILSDRPTWIEYQGPLITLGKKGIDGNLAPVSTNEVDGLKQNSSVKSVNMLTKIKVKVRSHQNSANTTLEQSILFSSSLMDILPLSLRNTMREGYEGRSVWVSHRFALKHFGRTDVIGEQLYAGEELKPFTINGFLEKGMDFVAGSEIDFWLPATFAHEMFELSLELPDSMPLAEQERTEAQLRKNLSKQIENQFAILRVFENSESNLIEKSVNEAYVGREDDTGLTVMTAGKGMKFWAINGVSLTPQIDASLRKQFWIIMILVFIAGGIASLNKYAFSTSQLIERKKEIAIRYVCGAQHKHLKVQFIIATLPLIAAVIIVSGLSIFAFYSFYAEHQLVTSLLGKPLQVPNVFSIIVGICLVIITIISAGLLPLANLKKRNVFIRDYGSTDDKVQKRGRILLLSAQISAAFIAAFCMLLLLKQQYDVTRLTNVNASLNETKITKIAGQISNLFLSSLTQMGHKHIAFSQNSFLEPKAVREPVYLQGQIASKATHMSIMPVSKDYLDLLGAEFTYRSNDLSSVHAVLNESAAAILGLSNNRTVQSASLSFGQQNTATRRISGIIKDLPHYGMITRSEPVVYVFYDDEITQSVYILSNLKDVGSGLNRAEYKVEDRNYLSEQIKKFDFQFMSFVLISISILLVLLFTIFTSLYYQSKAMVRSQSQLIGSLMAIGAKDFDAGVFALRFFIKPIKFLFIVSIVSFVLGRTVLVADIWELAGAAFIGLLVVILNIVLIVTLVIYKIRRLTISDLISYER